MKQYTLIPFINKELWSWDTVTAIASAETLGYIPKNSIGNLYLDYNYESFVRVPSPFHDELWWILNLRVEYTKGLMK